MYILDMISEFHAMTMGLFNLEYGKIALDYNKLFLDPLKANMTLIHEQSHNVLTNTTDYGLATIALFEIKNIAKSKYKDEIKQILVFMMQSQKTVQESTATFIEMQHLRRNKNKTFAYSYARNNLPDDYYRRFEALKDIFEKSKKYQDNFTSKIPSIALQNGIRQQVAQKKIYSVEEFYNFIANYSELPDIRFAKLVKAILKQPSLLNKSPKEICDASNISYFDETNKEDIKDFLNTLMEFTEDSYRYRVSDIKDARALDEIISSSIDNLLITDLNTNLALNAEVLYKVKDLQHYKDIFKAIVIGALSDDIDGKEILEETLARKFEASIIAFTTQVARYMYPSSFQEISMLIDEDFQEIPLIVKWGLYKPNGKILYFKLKRYPNVVLYNNHSDLIKSFTESTKINNLMYLNIVTSNKHPFQIFIIKDDNSVIHFINTLPKGISEIREALKTIIVPGSIEDFVKQKNNINLACSIWNGLDPNYDWFGNLSSSSG